MEKPYYADDLSEEAKSEIIDNELDTLAYNIRRLRKDRNISQKELAEKAKISLSTIIKIENATHKNVTYNQIRRLSFALDVPISRIIDVDFYVEKMDAINRFMLYYPLMKQADIMEIFRAVAFVHNVQSVSYLEDRLDRVYEEFSPKVKAFIELEYLINSSIKIYMDIKEGKLPEQFEDRITVKEYNCYKHNYDMLVKIKCQQSVITDSSLFLETGINGLERV